MEGTVQVWPLKLNPRQDLCDWGLLGGVSRSTRSQVGEWDRTGQVKLFAGQRAGVSITSSRQALMGGGPPTAVGRRY